MRMLRLLAVAAAATVLAACNSSSGGTSTDPVIGSDYPRSDTDFWNAYVRYSPQEAEKLGIKNLKTTNSENDVAKLTANVQTLLSQGAKGIVMAPQDTAAVAPTLQQLESKKIPVVTIDTRPDTGNVFMVVRADNRAYGEKACQFLGTKLQGKGKVVELMGDVASINGRDRTEAFDECMKKNFPGITVFAEPSKWDGATAANQLQTRLAAHPDIKGIYMQASFALSGTLQVLKQRNLLVAPEDPKHVFIVSNDGIPEELKDIEAGQIDATVSQPADLYAKYGLYYVQQAIAGKKFQPGPTDHDSTIIKVRDGVLEDQLAAPLVTRDGATIAGEKTLKFDDKTLWGNSVS
ncbi:ABC-type sugar transport system, periplasmic component [Cryptosporangium arvum DSM 44712]|uniref:ABC-type sugar transport system, periplasmic component n=2 Tax=Cryptosporangium TaxID=65502 RepID=A0A011ALW1_9ACTN|nr:ABC-type sugar transport system, periplasmic component [Cryptosporangium arvum DSM 44712]